MSENSPPPDGGGETVRLYATCKYKPNVKYNGYRVMVIDKTNINNMKIGDIISSLYNSNEIIEIVKVGRKTAIIHCRSHVVANHIAGNDEIKKTGLVAYIPHYFVTSCGIIFDIDKEYTAEYIHKHMDARQVEINRVQRITRREKIDGEMKEMDTNRIKVFFEGTEIPKYVFINMVRVECEPHMPKLLQCGICWKFGHWNSFCRSEEKICKNCSNNHSGIRCEEPPKCVPCGSDHPSDYVNCSERARQKNIRWAMTFHNLSRNEANYAYPRPRKHQNQFLNIAASNRYSILADNYDEDFPELGRRKNKNTAKREIEVHVKPVNPEAHLPTSIKNQTQAETSTKRSAPQSTQGQDDQEVKKVKQQRTSLLGAIPKTVSKAKKGTSGNSIQKFNQTNDSLMPEASNLPAASASHNYKIDKNMTSHGLQNADYTHSAYASNITPKQAHNQNPNAAYTHAADTSTDTHTHSTQSRNLLQNAAYTIAANAPQPNQIQQAYPSSDQNKMMLNQHEQKNIPERTNDILSNDNTSEVIRNALALLNEEDDDMSYTSAISPLSGELDNELISD